MPRLAALAPWVSAELTWHQPESCGIRPTWPTHRPQYFVLPVFFFSVALGRLRWQCLRCAAVDSYIARSHAAFSENNRRGTHQRSRVEVSVGVGIVRSRSNPRKCQQKMLRHREKGKGASMGVRSHAAAETPHRSNYMPGTSFSDDGMLQ